ncbi:CAAX amino terminal protease self- immunity [Thalassoglobus neptunius]|uniref:CAAX amino terminal protease self-immunity n=1 Tax=Thalassoglobus neptunius TaxID=1938619 RepID=A0A5C5X2Q9_9PLAN|nr:CPBP family intramembrane glutamic endopeptidase [Thalassoglobus neptunius]TWT57140.1 CAAX amino terminal protease self- immunity [Thalassoglobus neptunius]
MNLNDRFDFLRLTGTFMLSLLVITLGIAAIADIPLMSRIHWSVSDFLIGVIAAILMFAVFGQLGSLREEAGNRLGQSLASCRWFDLAILAVVVGIVEELLFRGLIEQSLQSLGPWTALLITNVVFGVLHAVSPLYAVVAGVLGAILSGLTWGIGDYNLLRPIVAHSLYDFIGFMIIANDYKRSAEST